MKRLFATIGLTCFSILTLLFYLNEKFVMPFIIVFSICFILSLCIKRLKADKTFALIFATALLSSLFFNFYASVLVKPVQEKYDNTVVAVKATLCEEPYNNNGYNYYEFKTDTVNDKKESFKFILSYKEGIDNLDIFDKCKFDVELNSIDKETGGRFLSNKTLFIGKVDFNFSYQVIKTEEKPLYYYAIKVRQHMAKALDSTMPSEYSNLAKAIALGDKTSITPEVKNDFRKTGVSHVIVVSGLHLSIISIYAYLLFSNLFKNKKLASLSTIVLIFIFMAVTGFSISVVRAGIMAIVYQLGKIILRQPDSLNSIGLAALIILILNPYSVGDIGMLLSFGATIGIVLWSDKITSYIKNKYKNIKRFKKPLDFISESVAVTLAAVLAITPITILFFGTFSTIVVISNLLVTYVIGLIIVFAILTGIFYYISFLSPLANAFAFFTSVVSKYVLFIVKVLAKIPFSVLYVYDDYILFWLALTLIIIGITLIITKQQKNKSMPIKLIGALSVVIFITGFLFNYISNIGVTDVIVNSVGNGSSVSLTSKENNVILSCGGDFKSRNSFINSVEKRGGKVNLLTVVCNSEESVNYSKALLKEFEVKDVLLYYKDTSETLTIKDYLNNVEQVESFNENYSVNLWDNIKVYNISIENSLFQYVEFKETTMLILPPNGDCSLLPLNYRTPNIIVMSNKIKNIEYLKADTAIVSQDIEGTEILGEDFPFYCKDIIFTCNGDIKLKVK